MPQKTIRFTIRPDGRVEERVEGVAGEACQQLTEEWKLLLERLNVRSPHPKRFCSLRSSPSLFPLI